MLPAAFRAERRPTVPPDEATSRRARRAMKGDVMPRSRVVGVKIARAAATDVR